MSSRIRFSHLSNKLTSLFHGDTIFQTEKSKVTISLFKTVKLSVSIPSRNLYVIEKSIKENAFHYVKIFFSGLVGKGIDAKIWSFLPMRQSLFYF